MTYETAKKLKDAGFPQYFNGFFYSEEDGGAYSFLDRNALKKFSKPVSLPTLSELIEACGEEFWMLEQRPNWEEYPLRYQAIANQLGKQIATEGSTPEEAVANLYLELNAVHK